MKIAESFIDICGQDVELGWGGQYKTGDNLEVVCAEFLTPS